MELQEFKRDILSIKNKLYRFARGFLQNDEEAEDTTQDVLLKLWDMRARLPEYNSIEALAMRMTKNMCLDKLKSKRNGAVGLENHAYHLVSSSLSPEKNVELHNLMDIVQKAIRQLPEQQQNIIRLRDMEEMEFEEIAQILGTDLNYIRVNLSRARKKLKEILIQVQNYGN